MPGPSVCAPSSVLGPVDGPEAPAPRSHARLEFTKNSRRSHEIAVIIFYDVTVAKLQDVSPISPSPFTTHTAKRPNRTVGAFCCSDLYLCLPVYGPSF